MIILLYMIIKQKGKKERKTTACQWDSALKRTSLYLIYPQKFHSCILNYILVLQGTNVHLFKYKLQLYLYKGTIVYIFQIVFCVCCMYSTWHTVMDTCTFTYYFILFYYTVHVSGIK